mgnify:CR=1 FL=1
MSATSARPDVPAQHQSFLSFDFGARRTGVASGNRLLDAATPQRTIVAEANAHGAEVASGQAGLFGGGEGAPLVLPEAEPLTIPDLERIFLDLTGRALRDQEDA